MPAGTFAIIIPARYASTRYPGKPLVPLRGAQGRAKTLIERSWQCAAAVAGHSGVWVATDDDRIADEVRGFGGEVVMTSPECRNGTERCADALHRLGNIADVVVNLQGDAPLSPPFVVERLVAALEEDSQAVMATPAVRCSKSVYDHLAADAANGRVGGTTVVFNRHYHALYFSKRILPYLPGAAKAAAGDEAQVPVHLHLGLYAYRPDALAAYIDAPVCELEDLEGLEQLRFLDLGLPVRVVPINSLGWDSIELNNPSDVPSIERVLAERGID
jgi:3-deoxy-manno-octulosonate cytidylyltransferase (CMP-KDO synthetase)